MFFIFKRNTIIRLSESVKIGEGEHRRLTNKIKYEKIIKSQRLRWYGKTQC